MKSIPAKCALILISALLIASCNSQNAVMMATLSAAQTQNVQSQIQAAVQATQLESIQLTQLAVPTNTSVPPPTIAPLPTWTNVPITALTAPTETPIIVVIDETSPTETPLSPSGGSDDNDNTSGSAGFVCYYNKPSNGMDSIRVENNSGQNFTIQLICSGGPCQSHSDTNYYCSFGSGKGFFWVWPGRYNITWTLCGKSESFVHQLNGQWYLKFSKCR